MQADRAITRIVRSIRVEVNIVQSQLPPISTRFQSIHLQSADECAHLPQYDDRRQALFTQCRLRMKKKDWSNTQFVWINSVSMPMFILLLMWAVFHSSMGQASSYSKSHQTIWEEIVTIPAERSFSSNPCLHSINGIPIHYSCFGSRWNRWRRYRFGNTLPGRHCSRVLCYHGRPLYFHQEGEGRPQGIHSMAILHFIMGLIYYRLNSNKGTKINLSLNYDNVGQITWQQHTPVIGRIRTARRTEQNSGSSVGFIRDVWYRKIQRGSFRGT